MSQAQVGFGIGVGKLEAMEQSMTLTKKLFVSVNGMVERLES